MITAWNTLARVVAGSAAAGAERVRVRLIDADRESRSLLFRTPLQHSRSASWTSQRELHSPICTASTAYTHVGSVLVAARSCVIGISALVVDGIKGKGSGKREMRNLGSRERDFMFWHGGFVHAVHAAVAGREGTERVWNDAITVTQTRSRRDAHVRPNSNVRVVFRVLRLGHLYDEINSHGLALRRRSSSRSSYTIERFAGSIKAPASRSSSLMFTHAPSKRSSSCVVSISGHSSEEGYSQRSVVLGFCES